jgi:hypothetical protein
MPRSAARIVLTLAFVIGGSGSAGACGWWDRCNGPYGYGPPYGNVEPPPVYVYDHRTGPTWTGNGWAHLPVGTLHPVPPAYAPHPPPPSYHTPLPRDRLGYRWRRHRPIK